MRQLQFFTTTQLATMRNRSAARNYSPAVEAFRRTHQRHRAWGLSQRHAERLHRMRTSPADQRPGPTDDERSMASPDHDLIGPEVLSPPAESPATASLHRTTTPAPPDPEAPAAAVQPTSRAKSPLAEVSAQAASRRPVRAASPSTGSDELAAGGKAICTAQTQRPPRPTPMRLQHSGECAARPCRPTAASRNHRYPLPQNLPASCKRETTPDDRKYRGAHQRPHRDPLFTGSRGPP